MYQIFLDMIGRLLVFTGFFFIFCKAKSEKRIALIYHNPTTATISNHFNHLAKYTSIENINCDGSFTKSGHGIENNLGTSFTFDDGYANYINLSEYFKSKNVRCCMFITTGTIGNKRTFWWENTSSKTDVNRLKSIPDNKRLEILENTSGWTDKSTNPDRINLSKDDLAKIIERNITVGAHTVTHPILSMCTDAKSNKEISESISFINSSLNIKTKLFAYPNGRDIDFGKRETTFLEQQGITLARTTTWGLANKTKKEKDYRHPGVIIFDNASIYELSARIVGIDHVIKSIHKTLQSPPKLATNK